jgi:type II secretion system protein I
MKQVSRNQNGFILLEVILASALVAIGLFSIIDALGRCLAAARSIQNYTVAEALLANKCTEFHVEQATNYLDQEGQFEDHPLYTWSRHLEGTDTEALWKQTITVYWHERGRLVNDSVVEYRYFPEKLH